MLYEAAAGATFVVCATTIIAQLTLIPLLMRHVDLLQSNVQHRMNAFQILSERAYLQLTSIRRRPQRIRRDNELCDSYEPGPPGPVGDDGEDGESGEDGPDGPRGKDARDIMQEMGEKCIICPQGAVGPIGPPGNPGPQGLKGEKGPPGIPGIDGRDGEIGAEGPPGFNGTAGRIGPTGLPGKSAPGGTGAPGPKGLPGPIGRTGPQGERGRRNFVYGPPGPDGKPGVNGMDGLVGNFGRRGEKGPIGEPGANAKFCPCPIELQLANAHRELRKGGEQLDTVSIKGALAHGKNAYASKTLSSQSISSDGQTNGTKNQRTQRRQQSHSQSTFSGQIPQPSVTFTDFTVPQTLPTVPPLPEELLNEGRGQRFPTRPTTTKNRIPSTIANDNTNTEPSISSRRISAPIVDLPNLSSMLPERNYRVGSTNQPLASNNVPPTLNIRTFLARRTANERSSSPAAALATGKTTEDPIQAHPLRGTDDLVLRSLSSTTQPSEPTSFDSLGGNTVNIASTLRQLLNNDNIEDITLNDSNGGAKNSMNEPVVLTVDGQTDDNEMVLSDETRRFFGAGIDSDISERNALLRAISDQSSTPTTNIHDEDAYPTDDQQSISSNLATMEVLIPIANEEGAEPVKQTPKTVRLSDDRERFQTRSAIKGKHRSQGTTSGVVTVNGSTVQEDASDDTVDFPDDDTNASSTSTDRPNEIITGYPEETPYPTRRRFIYVTKRPRNFGK